MNKYYIKDQRGNGLCVVKISNSLLGFEVSFSYLKSTKNAIFRKIDVFQFKNSEWSGKRNWLKFSGYDCYYI